MKSFKTLLSLVPLLFFGSALSATVAISVTNNIVGDYCFGTIELLPVGDDGPFDVFIEGPSQNPTYLGLDELTVVPDMAAGSYQITIINSDGCETTKEVTIACECILQIVGTIIEHPGTCSSEDGKLEVKSYTGNQSEVNYIWSNGAETAGISNLAPGTYSVTITDEQGCEAEGTYELVSPGWMNPEPPILKHTCEGKSDGSITLVFPEQLASDWQISSDFEGLQVFDNGASGFILFVEDAAAGIYCFELINNLDHTCSYSECIEIIAYEESSPLSITNVIISDNQSWCEANGSISFIVEGGVLMNNKPYLYLWNTGSLAQNMSNLVGGVYSVTVTDACGNQISQSFEVEDQSELELAFSQTATCSADNSNQGITTMLNASGDFTFLWSNGSTAQNLTGVEGGHTYSVTVSDAFGCEYVAENIAVQSTNISTDKVNPSNYQSCDGQISVTATGFGAPFQLQLLDDAGFIIYSTSQLEFEYGDFTFPVNLCHGSYEVKVSGNNGCVERIDVVLTPQDCELIIGISRIKHESVTTEIPCPPIAQSSADGIVELTLQGDDPDLENYLFTLKKGSDIIAEGVGVNIFNNLNEGSYHIVVEHINNQNCTQTKWFKIGSCRFYDNNCISSQSQVTLEEHHVEHISNYVPGRIILNVVGSIIGGGDMAISYTDPLGDIHYENIDQNEDRVIISNLTIIGEYCIQYNSGCEENQEICVNVGECPDVLTFGRNHPWTFHFEPDNRNDIDQTLTEGCYRLNGYAKDIPECRELPYIEFDNEGASHDYFYYTPFDDTDPCSGGTIEMYIYVFDSNGNRSVQRTENFTFTAQALHELSWSNTGLTSTGNGQNWYQDYFYDVPNHLGTESAVCKEGTYCVFDSEDIFQGLNLNRDILLAACSEWKHVCDLYPNSAACAYATPCHLLPCPSVICPEPCNYCYNGEWDSGEVVGMIDCSANENGPCIPCRCVNGILDYGETNIDCGGDCGDCCSNGVYDEGELFVDCGGPNCAPCPCTQDYECGYGYVCQGGVCVPGTNTGGNDSDGSTMCDPPCEYPLQCIDGECVPEPCVTNANCPEGYYCDDGDCVIEPCVWDSDCPDGFVCDEVSEECTPQPCSGGDCPDEFICGPDGFCIPDTYVGCEDIDFYDSQDVIPHPITPVSYHLFHGLNQGDILDVEVHSVTKGVRTTISQDGIVLLDVCGGTLNGGDPVEVDIIMDGPIHLLIRAEPDYCQDNHVSKYVIEIECGGEGFTNEETDSEVRVLATSGSQKYNVYPNPFNNFINVEFNKEDEGYINYKIVSSIGTQLFTGSYYAFPGNNILTIDEIESHNSGLYYLILTEDGESSVTEKIIKLK